MTAGRKTAAKPPRKSAAARRIAAGQAAAEAAVAVARGSAGTRKVPRRSAEKGPDNIPGSIPAPTWRGVLGDELARRVALAAVSEGVRPAAFALAAVEEAVVRAETRRQVVAARVAAGGKCTHPEKDRRGMRCGACGTRGLPAVP